LFAKLKRLGAGRGGGVAKEHRLVTSMLSCREGGSAGVGGSALTPVAGGGEAAPSNKGKDANEMEAWQRWITSPSRRAPLSYNGKRPDGHDNIPHKIDVYPRSRR